ncbi:hypothetical protein [Okeania sp. SIO1I7]|nr:hypothetical protein [Okeania sp. SIO1I7]NET25029.1 hypothetical protein [Okeania sp. SIO1I7]
MILSNSQVLALLELKKLPSTVSFQRHGFVLESDSRQQQGQQKGWRVLK